MEVCGRLVCAQVPLIVLLDLPSLATSLTVANVRRNAAADLTRGAWPQSMRARAENISAIVAVESK